MQKKIRKIVRFIVIVLLLTICALIVNKTTEFKIFGAKEVHAGDEPRLGDGTYIQVTQTHYTVEVGETLEIPVILDESNITPEQRQHLQILIDEYEDIEDLDLEETLNDTTIVIRGLNPNSPNGNPDVITILLFDTVANDYFDSENVLLEHAHIEIEVVEPASEPEATIIDAGPYTISTTKEFETVNDYTINMTAKVGDELSFPIEIKDDDYDSGAYMMAYVEEDVVSYGVSPEGQNKWMGVVGETEYEVYVTCPAEGEAIIQIGYVDNDYNVIGGEVFYINLTIEDGNVKVPVEDISVYPLDYSVLVGETITINASLLPADATEIPSNLMWTVDDQTILELQSQMYDTRNKVYKGTFLAKQPGSTVIYVAVSNDGPETSVNVAVTKNDVASITMNETHQANGLDPFNLTATVGDQGIYEEELESELVWTISDTSVLSLGNDNSRVGKVYSQSFTPLKAGTTTVTATYPGTNISDTCTVTIVNNISVTGVELDKEADQVTVYNSVNLSASIKPLDATNPPSSLNWIIGDSNILVEDSSTTNNPFNKKFNAIGVGETTVTVKTPDGAFQDVATITVVGNHIIDLAIDEDSLELVKGNNDTIEVTWNPESVLPEPTVNVTFSEAGIASYQILSTTDKKCTIKVTGENVGTTNLIVTAQGVQVGCEITVLPVPVEIQSISLDKTTESLKVGQGVQLTVSVNPENANVLPTHFDWDISDDKMEQVMLGLDTDELAYSAVFNALEVGTTTITVSVPNTNISASCVVTISPADVLMTGIELDVDDEIEVEALDTFTINASIIPTNTTNPPTVLVWEIGDQTIVGEDDTVTQRYFTRIFEAKKPGTTTIKVRTEDEEFEKTISVTVIPTKVTEMNIDKTELSFKVGDRATLNVTWTPENLEPEANPIDSFSEDGIVATRNRTLGNGEYAITIEALKVGTTTLTVALRDKQVTCDITVEPIKLEGISLNRKTATIKVGSDIALRASLIPENTTELPDNLIWSVTGARMEQVVTGLDDDEPIDYREFYAHEVGTATITVSVPDTDISDSCVVTIIEDDVDMTGLQLDKETATVEIYKSLELNASVIPGDATNAPDSLVWVIEDEDVLEEDSSTANNPYNKKFNAIGIGESKVTVKTPDETFEAEATITVTGNHVEELNINKSYLTVELDDNDLVELTWTPESVVPNPDVEITFTDSEVASATINSVNDEKCVIKITPLKVGRTTMTASVQGKAAECEIVVLAPSIAIQSISLDKQTATVKVGEGVQLTVSVNPENATALPDEFKWSLSNTKMQQIMIGQDTGELEYTAEFKALEVGITTITVKIPNTNIQASCTVTIEKADEPSDPGDTSDTSDTSDTTDTSEQLVVDIDNYEESESGNTNYIASNQVNTLAQLMSNIETNGEIKVYIKGQLVTDNNKKLPTGAVVEITKGNQSVTYDVVVQGDINGDAEKDDIDLLMLARFNAGFENEVNLVTGPYLRATNVRKDNSYGDDADLLKLSRMLVGLE